MNMDWPATVNKLQVDMTSHCNARCAGCIRQIDGTTTVKPDLPLVHFPVDVFERVASEDTRGWFMKELVLNGNWGDPMMHPNLVEMLETWCRYHPESTLIVHTNGSMRSTQFWNDLAEVSRRFANHIFIFAVDGLEDTHSIYRVRTKYDKILENIKAFTNAKGRARVTMTAFEHNKHQVKDVEKIAEELGCIEFELRPSHLAHGVQDGVVIQEADIESYQVSFDTANGRMSDLRDCEVYKEAEPEDIVETTCPWYNDRQVQIDPWSRVWPCCHVSHFGHNNKDLETYVDNSFIEARESNLLTKNSLHNILSDIWFSETLPDAVRTASWKTCREECGVCEHG